MHNQLRGCVPAIGRVYDAVYERACTVILERIFTPVNSPIRGNMADVVCTTCWETLY